MDTGNLIPFFPQGAGPILPTTALIFVSFLGFVKIAAVAEEIRDPERNLPRALIGSVALVTGLYVVILLVIAGTLSQGAIAEVRDPLATAARSFFGEAGVVVIVFAGLLATLSSANASILAASRINLAMARDRLVPGWLAQIHSRLMTPHRAILFTAFLALAFLFLDSLEGLAKIASSLQLYSYAALNVGCVVLRTSQPDWYRPTFRTPGNPLLQIVASVACLVIILASGPFAQIAVVGLVIVSLVWYSAWGRSRVEIDHGLTALSVRVVDAEVEKETLARTLERDSPIRQVLFGSIPDLVADQAPCSVLMVHRFLPKHWSVGLVDSVKRIRERLGATTSPEEDPAGE